MPAREGATDAIRRDNPRNLIVCPLPHDGAFMEIFYQGWGVVQQVISADGQMPREVALPRPAERRVAGSLVDRREFPDIGFDRNLYKNDPEYRERYKKSERHFLEIVREVTGGRGVSIFVDFIGAPFQRATFKALARPAVVSTAGWKMGMKMEYLRAVECIQHHIHVHTHYARHHELVEARDYAVKHNWMPEISEMFEWKDIGSLATAAAANELSGYFPAYKVTGD